MSPGRTCTPTHATLRGDLAWAGRYMAGTLVAFVLFSGGHLLSFTRDRWGLLAGAATSVLLVILSGVARRQLARRRRDPARAS